MIIAPLLLKWDYGQEKRGVSLEKKYFYPALQKLGKCYPLWLEENGFPDHPEVLHNTIMYHINKIKPDLVFTILMEHEIQPYTLKAICDMGISVVNWFCDDQWRFEWSKTIAPSLTYSVTTDKYSLSKYRELGFDARLASWGAEYIKKPKIHPKRDVSFVGGYDIVREWYLHDIPFVERFGYGWENGKVDNPSEIYGSTRINLNLSNSIPKDIRFYHYLHDKGLTINGGKHFEQLKARHFEIPAAGGFQLAHYAIGLEDYFEIGKEIAVYTNKDDMKTQIDYYLENDEERESIRVAGHKRAEEYTYEKILKGVLCEH